MQPDEARQESVRIRERQKDADAISRGAGMQAGRAGLRGLQPQCRRKSTSTIICTATGRP